MLNRASTLAHFNSFPSFFHLYQTEQSTPSILLLSQPFFPLSDVYCQTFFIIDVYCQTIPISVSAIPSVSPAGPLAPTLSHFSRLCLTRLSLRSMQLTATSEVRRGGLWFLDAKRHKKPSLSSTIRCFLFFPQSLFMTLSERREKERRENTVSLDSIGIISLAMTHSWRPCRYGRDAHVSRITQVCQCRSEPIWYSYSQTHAHTHTHMQRMWSLLPTLGTPQ